VYDLDFPYFSIIRAQPPQHYPGKTRGSYTVFWGAKIVKCSILCNFPPCHLTSAKIPSSGPWSQRKQQAGPSLLLSYLNPPRHVIELCRLRVEIKIYTSRKEVVWPGHRFLWNISQEFEPRLSQTKTYGVQDPFKASKSFYIPHGLTWKFSTSCQQRVFMYFVWICERIAISSLYIINWLASITQMECVYCAVRAKSFNMFQIIHIL
jgi:hypothetical protein